MNIQFNIYTWIAMQGDPFFRPEKDFLSGAGLTTTVGSMLRASV